MTLGRMGAALLAWLSASMLGLAAGAIWMVPTMLRGAALPWLALPLGWLLGLAIRRWVRRAGLPAAVLASYALLLAAFYLHCLMVGANLAGMTGIDLTDALRQAGPRLLAQLAWMALLPTELLIYLLGAVLAAATAWRRPVR
jgi:vitamin B12 transport system permease protein